VERFRELVPGVLVATAEFATTNTTAVLDGSGGCLLIDPGVTVSDVAALAADLGRAGLRPQAGFSTHPHWDHVLWSRDLGDVPRYGAPAAMAILRDERDGMLAQLAHDAPGHDLDLVGHLTGLAEGADTVPWGGPAAQLVIHDGHAPGHAAVFLPGTGVLLAGDMLSDIEIPLLDTVADDPLGDYRAGLELLVAVPGVRWLVPGHGSAGDAAEMQRRLAADRHYLDLLAAGEPFDDPRCTKDWLRASHRDHLRTVAGLDLDEPGH
jgi:hydroxyacylglutathione hydrolase